MQKLSLKNLKLEKLHENHCESAKHTSIHYWADYSTFSTNRNLV